MIGILEVGTTTAAASGPGPDGGPAPTIAAGEVPALPPEVSDLGQVEVSAPGLIVVLLGGILLYAVMRKVRDLLSRAPMGTSRRRLVRRARPIAEAVVVVGYLVSTVPLVLRGHPAHTAIVLALMVLGFVLLTWFALRDAVSGMFLKAGEFCQVGDFVQVEGVRGRVRGLGFRVLALETEGGEEAFIPYSRISRQSLVRRPAADGLHRHSFEVDRPAGIEPVDLKTAIRRMALTSHWSSVARDPEVMVEEERCAVTIFALDPDRAHDVEKHVRNALSRLP